MEDKEINSYSEGSIQVLTMREAILKRPGMYIGNPDLRGYNQMIAYLLEDLLDENEGDVLFEAEFHPKKRTSLKIRHVQLQPLIDYLAEFAVDFEQGRPALIRFGLPVLCTLSEFTEVGIDHAGERIVFKGINGVLETTRTPSEAKEEMISIDFVCDKKIFKDFEIDYDIVNLLFRRFAILNPSLKIISTDLSSAEMQRNVYCFPGGIFKEMDYQEAQLKYSGLKMRLDLEERINGYDYQISIAYGELWPETTVIRTYAANIETFLGGSLEDGVLDGLLSAMRQLISENQLDFVLNKKELKRQLIMIAAVKGPAIVFSGSIKAALGMPQVRKAAKVLVSGKVKEYLAANPAIAEKMLEQFSY